LTNATSRGAVEFGSGAIGAMPVRGTVIIDPPPASSRPPPVDPKECWSLLGHTEYTLNGLPARTP
jgi:hypothetical protein